jgi:plasmid maintenance system antidote protein VapI
MDVQKSQMMPNQAALLRLRKKQVEELIQADRRITIDIVATVAG